MRIRIFARSFFEAKQGKAKEAYWVKHYRIVSINSVVLPEMPPFTQSYWDCRNLLILFFDDYEHESNNAFSRQDAEKVIDFALQSEFHLLPVLSQKPVCIAVKNVADIILGNIGRDDPADRLIFIEPGKIRPVKDAFAAHSADEIFNDPPFARNRGQFEPDVAGAFLDAAFGVIPFAEDAVSEDEFHLGIQLYDFEHDRAAVERRAAPGMVEDRQPPFGSKIQRIGIGYKGIVFSIYQSFEKYMDVAKSWRSGNSLKSSAAGLDASSAGRLPRPDGI